MNQEEIRLICELDRVNSVIKETHKKLNFYSGHLSSNYDSELSYVFDKMIDDYQTYKKKILKKLP